VFAGAQDGVLAVALVVATLGLPFCGLVGHPKHRQPASLAAKEAAQEVGVLLVVAEGELGIALQLGFSEPMGFLIYEGSNGDRDPLLFGSKLSRGVLTASGSASPGFLWRHVAVTVGVGCA
jgi:hypothetical protein